MSLMYYDMCSVIKYNIYFCSKLHPLFIAFRIIYIQRKYKPPLQTIPSIILDMIDLFTTCIICIYFCFLSSNHYCIYTHSTYPIIPKMDNNLVYNYISSNMLSIKTKCSFERESVLSHRNTPLWGK